MPSSSDRPSQDITPAEPLAGLLGRWQDTGDVAALETLVLRVLPMITATAADTLRRCGICDPAAADDAVSLVLDHLRRLSETDAGEKPVAPFERSFAGMGGDCGGGYLRLLARSRARDIARSRRRRARTIVCFGDATASRPFDHPGRRDWRAADASARDPLDADMLTPLVARLPPRDRTVIELLLEGLSQRAIAHVLDLSEGSVSRIRARAVGRLRDLLDAHPPGISRTPPSGGRG